MISDSIPMAKVLKPNPEEFANFEQFVENCDKDKNLQGYGMYKVVPPSKWKARSKNYETEFDRLQVNSPIEQNAQGKGGIYELYLIQKKSMKLNEYRKKVECFEHLTDGKSIKEVEEMFWKNIAFSPPIYGADMRGNLFDEDIEWNLANLPGPLKEGLSINVSGVNDPYLYVGSWKALFGWHKEDLDLYSINYLHYGKPKQFQGINELILNRFWYCLPPSEGKKLEDYAKQFFPEGFSKCKEFLRHKTVMMHPYIMKQKIPDLKIHKQLKSGMIQYPGEFVITFGGAYHAGFNWGFNIAEAVNFATTRWLEILPHVDFCHCISDSVKIEKEPFLRNLLHHSFYNKNPVLKKVCNDLGITKDGIEVEEVNSDDTTDTKDNKIHKHSRHHDEMADLEEKKVEDETKETKKAKSGSHKKKSPKSDELSGDNEDGENIPPRISNRSKKIRKISMDFLEDRKVSKTTEKANKNKKSNQPKGKVNWVQCDDCQKWRVLDGEEEETQKIMKMKKVFCSNLNGKTCDDSEDSA